MNRLAQETSPYLRQHAANPVDWYPWGEDAFQRARNEDKPIHLSVGYAACHWCHVMAHECFEDPAIAQVMNAHFINIKVDRQERPDLDDIYQKVAQMMGQGGGWPLTVFLNPAGEPFYGGTYFPPEDRYGRPGFKRLLLGLSEAWQQRRELLQQNIDQFRQGYQSLAAQSPGEAIPTDADVTATAALALAAQTDPQYGGLGGAPKFPNVSCLDLMLRVYHRTRDPALLHALDLTLDHMAAGGLYDQLGGGFARYSVDERWAIPHFEKMLYDNGQLVKLYADAYRLTGKPTWRRVVEQTIDYILRDLTHPDGAFYASEDADSEGEEGKFYAWTPAEVRAVLGDTEGDLASRAYGITEHGNFEHGSSVLYSALTLSAPEEARLDTLRRALLTARNQRVRPARDENIITAWNALMIQGLCAAYQATGHTPHLTAALRAADFLQDQLTLPEGGVARAWKDGIAKVPGFLEDYAYLANALLDLYESCFMANYLERARQLVDGILTKFWDEGLYFTAQDGEPLIHRPCIPNDNACPSAIASSVLALQRCFALTGEERYHRHAEQLWQQYGAAAAQNAFTFAHLLAAREFAHGGPLAIVLAGDKLGTSTLAETLHRLYLPARVLARADDVPIGVGREALDGEATAYVCQHQTCEAPFNTAQALQQRCTR